MWYPLEWIPFHLINTNWILKEIDEIIKVNITQSELNSIRDIYTYVKTSDIHIAYRHYVEEANCFNHEGELWTIIHRDIYKLIFSNKIDFRYNLLPIVIRNRCTIDLVYEGEDITFIDETLYIELRNNYTWLPLLKVPTNHWYKGEQVVDRDILIIKKSILPTIFRKFHRKG